MTRHALACLTEAVRAPCACLQKATTSFACLMSMACPGLHMAGVSAQTVRTGIQANCRDMSLAISCGYRLVHCVAASSMKLQCRPHNT